MLQNTFNRKSLSPARISWNKFRSSKIAVISLSWIIINITIAIFGYVIAPDSTPYANHQQLELRTKSPGFHVETLWVKSNKAKQPTSVCKEKFYGSPLSKTSYPLHSWTIKNSTIEIRTFSGDPEVPGMEREFNLADVLYSIDTNKEIREEDGYLHFTLYNGESKTEKIDYLRQEVIDNNIDEQYFILGTDQFGRDLLSQLIIGTRVSLSVGFIAVIIALIIGVSLGSIAGFFRGKIDDFIMWLINIVWSLPTLIIVIAITFAIGKGFWQVFVAVGLTMWVDIARVTRGQIISLREKDFVESARALGLGTYRIITKHILPNIYGPLIVISAANFASAILIEAGLSFLGMGVQPPVPSWGSMIKENYGYIILDKAYLAILPGACIMLIVLSFLLSGNSLRDALDKTYHG